MAIVVESKATAFVGDSAGSVTVTKPAGTVEGDLLIAGVTDDGSSSNISPPSGWTEIDESGSDHRHWVGYKIAGASEPADYTWSDPTGSETWIAGILRISGFDAITPLDVASGISTGSSSSPLAPSITTVTDNCLILRFKGNDDDDTTATPGGTNQWNEYSADHGASGPCHGACFSDFLVTAGATGTAGWTISDDGWTAVTVAIRPASAGIVIPRRRIEGY